MGYDACKLAVNINKEKTVKSIKLIIKAVLAIVVLLLIAVVAAVILVDPNDYKPQIVQLVKDQTGRDLTISGDIGWSLFPRLGFQIGRTELSNADGFQSRVFAEVENIDAGLQIMPLLRGAVELDVITLDGMMANLEINADGRSNWDDLLQAGADSPAQEAAKPAADTTDTGHNADMPELPPIRLQGIRIDNASVSYTDRSAGSAVTMEQFSFSTGVVKLWEPIDFKGRFTVSNQSPQLTAKLNYSGTLLAQLPENRFALQGFKLKLDAAGEPVPNGRIVVNMAADVSANTAKEVATLEQLLISFDDTRIEGHAQVNGFAKPAVNFKVAIDQLNADRYIPQSPAPAAAATPATASADNTDLVIELPMQTLRDLNMDGELTVGRFQVMNLKTQNFQAVLSAHKGLIQLKPLGIEMYSGRFDGNVTVDARKAVPAYAVAAKLDNMQVNPLLVDFAELDIVEGTGAFTVNISTAGQRLSELKRGLNGQLSAVFDKGVLKFNMLGGLGEFFTGLDKKLAQAGELSRLAGKQDTADKIAKTRTSERFAKLSSGKTTEFKALAVSGQIVNGVIRTNDLDVQSDNMRAQGKGSVDIASEYLDMQLALDVDGRQCSIPLQGKIADIDYVKFAKNAAPNCLKDAAKTLLNDKKAQLQAEAKARLEAEKAKAKAELEKKKAEAKARLEAEKAKARAELDKKKAEAEAKAKAKLDKEKRRAKDKLEEKLKGLF